MSDADLSLFAACQPGLEPLLVDELQRLDIDAEQTPGGALFTGSTDTVLHACLWLGTASHVRVRLAHFRCRALGELQRKAAELPWRDWLLPSRPVLLSARSRRSRVYHTGAISERIYNAIGAAFGSAPPIAAKDEPAVGQVVARFEQDLCTISIDATATPLHRRGYRLDGRKAPLREDLAHALLLASRWDPDTALLDPFCGSGTIAIEAAAMASGLAPGRLRPPPLEHTARFDAARWQQIVAEAAPRVPAQPLVASDRDEGAVAAARANAERAGVAAFVEVHKHALAAQPWLAKGKAPARGAVVTNPPFGMRVRGGGNLLPLYQTIGTKLRGLGPGWVAGILAHDVRLARRTGLGLEAAFTTKHGGMSVTAMRTAPADSAADGDAPTG